MKLFIDLLFIAGLASICFALDKIYPPLAFLFLGFVLVGGSLLIQSAITTRRPKKKE